MITESSRKRNLVAFSLFMLLWFAFPIGAEEDAAMDFVEWNFKTIVEEAVPLLEALNRGHQYAEAPPVGTCFTSYLAGMSLYPWEQQPADERLEEMLASMGEMVRAPYLPSNPAPFSKSSPKHVGTVRSSYSCVCKDDGTSVRLVLYDITDGPAFVYLDGVEPMKSHDDLYAVASKYLKLPEQDRGKPREHIARELVNVEALMRKAQAWGAEMTVTEAEEQVSRFPETREIYFADDNMAVRGGRITIDVDDESRQTNAIFFARARRNESPAKREAEISPR